MTSFPFPINKLFDTLWPDLETSLGNIPAPNSEVAQARPQTEVLEDLVQAIRSLEARFRQNETVFSITEDPSIKFIISSDGEVETSLPTGEKLVLVGPPSRLIPTVAARMGISADRYNQDWHFEEIESGRMLYKRDELLELGSKYRGKVCNLRITNIPF